MTADIYSLAVSHIIQGQQAIIGPIAIDQAKKVPGLKVVNANTVEISGNGKEILDHLVHQYEGLFGRASIEVCKDAIREINPAVPREQLPDILQ